MFPTPSQQKMTCDIASQKFKTGIRSNLSHVDGQNPGPFGMNENILNCPKNSIPKYILPSNKSFTHKSNLEACTNRNSDRNLKWDDKITENDIINYNNGRTGYILEVDSEFPKELHDLHNDDPLTPEVMKLSHIRLMSMWDWKHS